jgi:hypothetical protein
VRYADVRNGESILGSLLNYVWLFFTLLVGFLMWAAQVPPDQAVSNIYAWLQRIGIANPPEWLRQKIADEKVRRAAFVALLLLVFVGGIGADYQFGIGRSLVGTADNAPTAGASPYHWDALSSDEAARLRAELTAFTPQKIAIVCNTDDCGDLSRSFRDAFRLAGWDVIDTGPSPFLRPTAGVSLAVNDEKLRSLGDKIESASHHRLRVQIYQPFPFDQKYANAALLLGSKP